MADKQETVYVQFKEHKPTKLPNGKRSKAPETLEFGNGEFRRTFKASEQPFAVTKEDAGVLKNSGLFVDAAAPGESESQQESESNKSTPAKRKSQKPIPADVHTAEASQPDQA